MASEASACAEFIYKTLSGDAALADIIGDRLYPDIAPLGTAHPYSTYAFQSPGVDAVSVGLVRATSSPKFHVKTVTDGNSYSPISPASDRTDALLHGARVPWPSAAAPTVMLTCTRESELRYSEFTNNIRYNHLGALYAFTAQPVTDEGD